MPIEKLMEKKDPEMAGLHQEGSSLLLPKDKRPIGRQGKETNNHLPRKPRTNDKRIDDG